MKSSIWIIIIIICFLSYINCETIVITVGERGLNFSPQNITARVNDVIRWRFISGKHQIVQSDGPAGNCLKSSRFNNPFTSLLQEGGEYFYTIPQTSGTLYYFCAFSTHCAYGMWGTININLEASTVVMNSQTPTPTTVTPTEIYHAGGSDNLPIIIGSSIGGFFALSILGLVAFMIYRRKRYQKQFEVAMNPYDPKLAGGGGGGNNDRDNNMDSLSTISRLHNDANTEVVSTISNLNTMNSGTRPYEETIRSYEESEHGGGGGNLFRGSSKRDSYQQFNDYSNYNTGEGSRSPLSPPPMYQQTFNHYDNVMSYQQQQQQQQQPPIPPRPANVSPPPQQFGAPYVPPRPSAVSKYPPQYGPSSSTTYQELPYQEPQYQSRTSSDPFGPANPGQYYQQQQQQYLPRQLPPPPASQPLPPPPSQSQYNPAQYYGSNSDNLD